MQGILMVGLVFACLLHNGDQEEFDIRKFAGIWHHTAEVVNGSLQNELDSLQIKAKISRSGGILLEIRRVQDGDCESDVIFLAATDTVNIFDTIRISTVRFLEADFKNYCIIHVEAHKEEATFMHLFTRTPKPSEDAKLYFGFFAGVMGFDFKQIVYIRETEWCRW